MHFSKIAILVGVLVFSSVQFAEPIDARVTGAKAGLSFRLLSLLQIVSLRFGREVQVTSGCRSHRHNRRIGGARRSMHLQCKAADIRVIGVPKHRVLKFARRLPGRGGVGTYCRNSVVHIDVGPRREWHQGCSKRKFKGKRRPYRHHRHRH